jgi:hypothetical protein
MYQSVTELPEDQITEGDYLMNEAWKKESSLSSKFDRVKRSLIFQKDKPFVWGVVPLPNPDEFLEKCLW